MANHADSTPTPNDHPPSALFTDAILRLPTMSSREIAELTGSTHDNVLKTVRALIARGVVSGNETHYIHPQNGQTYTEFKLDYRNTMVVVSGYSAEMRAKIVDRWIELEKALGGRSAPDPLAVLNDPAAMRGLLLTYADKVLALEADREALTPKAAAHDRIAEAYGSLCVTDAAKTLQVPPKVLFRWLRENAWIYRRTGMDHDIAYQVHITAGRLIHKVELFEKPDGTDGSRTQVRVTPKGMTVLAKAFPPVAMVAA